MDNASEIRDLIRNKKWAELKRMILNLQSKGADHMELAKLVNKIVHEALAAKQEK